MEVETTLSKYKDISQKIIKITNNLNDKILELHYKSNQLESFQIISIIKYLNKTDYKDYKFNQYSVKKNGDTSLIIFSYISPKVCFSK